MNKFKIQEQYEMYLKRVDLFGKIHPESNQYIELRRAFFGAWGQLLELQMGMCDMSYDEGSEMLESMWNQVEEFFDNEIKQS